MTTMVHSVASCVDETNLVALVSKHFDLKLVCSARPLFLNHTAHMTKRVDGPHGN